RDAGRGSGAEDAVRAPSARRPRVCRQPGGAAGVLPPAASVLGRAARPVSGDAGGSGAGVAAAGCEAIWRSPTPALHGWTARGANEAILPPFAFAFASTKPDIGIPSLPGVAHAPRPRLPCAAGQRLQPRSGAHDR